MKIYMLFKIWYDSGVFVLFCCFLRVIFIFKLIELYLLGTEIWYDSVLFSTTRTLQVDRSFMLSSTIEERHHQTQNGK